VSALPIPRRDDHRRTAMRGPKRADDWTETHRHQRPKP
jgi:hypothetical protein